MPEPALAYEAAPRPRLALVAEDDTAHASGHLASIYPETIPPGLSPTEIDVLGSISHGNTTVQVARELDMAKAEVDESRDALMAKFATRSIAVATDQSIRRGILAIEVRPEIAVIEGLTKADPAMLRLYAHGVSNHRIAAGINIQDPTGEAPPRVSVRSVEAYHDRLLKRLGAWSRAHAVRRGHELGILR